MELMWKKSVLVFGAVAIVLLLVSSATAVPQVQSKVVTKTLNETEKTKTIVQERKILLGSEELKNFILEIKQLIRSEKFKESVYEINSWVKQKFDKNVLKNLDVELLIILVGNILSKCDFPTDATSCIYINGHERIDLSLLNKLLAIILYIIGLILVVPTIITGVLYLYPYLFLLALTWLGIRVPDWAWLWPLFWGGIYNWFDSLMNWAFSIANGLWGKNAIVVNHIPVQQ